MRRVRSETLNERIASAGLPSELSALAATFNEMLDRLEEAFARLSRFSSDIAHELRTPINNLRGEVEVTLGRARTPEEYREALGSSLEECLRLSRMIELPTRAHRGAHDSAPGLTYAVDYLGYARSYYPPATLDISGMLRMPLDMQGRRSGSRGTSGRSTPPNPANRARMDSARFPRPLPAVVSATFRISRASCSIERPWWAARIRSRAFVSVSKRRTVMLAIEQ